MPVDRATFDADLAAYNTAVSGLIAAIEAFLGLQPVLDLAAEDATVQAGLAAVAAEIAKIPPPPPPPPVPGP